MAGISSLHGLHQVAQKLSRTTFHRGSESSTSCPWRSLRTIWGAGLPTKGGRPAMPSKPASIMSTKTADHTVFIFVLTLIKTTSPSLRDNSHRESTRRYNLGPPVPVRRNRPGAGRAPAQKNLEKTPAWFRRYSTPADV